MKQMLSLFGGVALWTLLAATVSAADSGTPTAGKPAATAKDTAAASGQGAKAEAGLRVYTSDIHDSADADSGGNPALTLIGTRNGACSGKVVVVGPAPLAGLKAAISELKQGAAAIPAGSVSVRYGVAWDANFGGDTPRGGDRLFEAPPAEFPAGKAPVWVTVQVPKTAQPGPYAGELTITVKGGGPFKVPVKLTVQDWTLPDTQDFRTWMEVLQSPDTLAEEYKVPQWSAKHWTMIGQSLKLIGSIGSLPVYIPLICHTNFGNEQSMVRWIKKGSKYEYDFTVMDKYLDAAAQNMGKPKLVTLWAWDVFSNPPKADFMAKNVKGDGGDAPMLKARVALQGKGPPVTVLDPATGKTEMVYLPPYETPEGQALWQPLWKELRKRLEQRGLWSAAMLGVTSDWWPSREQVVALNDLSGGLPWASSSHHTGWLKAQTSSGKGALFEIGTIKYINVVLEFEVTINPSLPGARTYGWKNPIMNPLYWRYRGYYNGRPLSALRHTAECAITGMERGLGHIGGDFWNVFQNKKGVRVSGVGTRYPESQWHSQAISNFLLAPGPDGPVGTVRLEVMREGVQECEARIAIETILTDPKLKAKLDAGLAQRAQDFLDEQQRNCWRSWGAPEADFQKWGHVPSYATFDYDILGLPKPRWIEADGARWFLKSGWANRVGQLYALAGDVTRKAAN